MNKGYNYLRFALGAVGLLAPLVLPLVAAAAAAPKAEIFAPGVICLPERNEFCLAMSPDEQEIFFTVRKAPGWWEIHRSTRKGKTWQASTIAPFSGVYSDSEPSLSPDGQRLFFSSNRPRPAAGEPATQTGAAAPKGDAVLIAPAAPKGDAVLIAPAALDYDIWVVERQGDGWSAPWPLPEPVNGPGNQWRACQSKVGNIYYSSQGLWRISMDDPSAVSLVKLFDPQKPGPLIGGHAFIAPDESYMLTAWMDGPGGRGGWDIYVSFRDAQGNWGPSINLGEEVNSSVQEDFPSVSPSGRDLYFFRYWKDEIGESGEIFRIDASILQALRKK